MKKLENDFGVLDLTDALKTSCDISAWIPEIKYCPAIQKLILNYGVYPGFVNTDKIVRQIFRVIVKSYITDLEIRTVGLIEDDELELLSAALKLNNNITHLKLHIGSRDGAPVMAEILAVNKNITYLDFDDLSMEYSGYRTVLAALKTNHTLLELKVCSGVLDDIQEKDEFLKVLKIALMLNKDMSSKTPDIRENMINLKQSLIDGFFAIFPEHQPNKRSANEELPVVTSADGTKSANVKKPNISATIFQGNSV